MVILKMSVITIWQRYNSKTEQWEHNHISDGWSDNVTIPVAVNKKQKKSWSGSKWQKIKGYLDENNKVIQGEKQ